MDIAALYAALMLTATIQGGMLLQRWRRMPSVKDVAVAGIASLFTAVGAALFGSRYFGAGYLPAVVLSNMLLLTAIALHYQSIRVADGLRPSLWQVAAPGALWVMATATPVFMGSFPLRAALYTVIATALSLAIAAHLLRQGLKLPGRKVWFGFWAGVAALLASRMIDAQNASVVAGAPHGGFGWYALHLMLGSAATMGIGYIHLTQSDAMERIDQLIQGIQSGLHARAAKAATPHRSAEGGRLWSLRIDRLSAGHRFNRRPRQADVALIVQAISDECPILYDVATAGIDRITWRTPTPAPGGQTAQDAAHTLARAIRAILERPSFPTMILTCGACDGLATSREAAVAAADRKAIRIARNH